MVIETFLIVYYTLLVLNLSIISVSLKTWAWLQLGHTQKMGVVAPRAPLLIFLEITTEKGDLSSDTIDPMGIQCNVSSSFYNKNLIGPKKQKIVDIVNKTSGVENWFKLIVTMSNFNLGRMKKIL